MILNEFLFLHLARIGIIAVAAAIVGGCGEQHAPHVAQHVVKIPWALGGKQIVADLHTHTRLSNGALDADALVRKAFVGGCQAVAITDHADGPHKAGTVPYVDGIAALRKKYSQRIVIGGLSWSVPMHGGRVNMGVLLDPAAERQLVPFKQRFDKPDATVAQAFEWLAQEVKESTAAVYIYHHPSRYGESAEQVVAEWTSWRRASDRAIGFEGGPGRQNLKPYGDYTKTPTELRWDPVVAQIGGAWDQLLDRGDSPWAALASSAYYKPETEHTPCEFSRTVVTVPEATASGVLKALHAGSFWAEQGRFLDYLQFTASAAGLEVPATPGETIRVIKDSPLSLRIALQRVAELSASPLSVEIIGNCANGKPQLLTTLNVEPRQSEIETELPAAAAGKDGTSCYLRARVRGRTVAGETALAHVNPIRVRLMETKRP